MFTNSTTPYGLPQWLATDVPNWDIDLNAAFKIINDTMQTLATGIEQGTETTDTINGKINTINQTLDEIAEKLNAQGDLNKTVADEIADIQSKITKLQSDYNTLHDDVSGNQEAINGLGTSITNIQTDLNDINTAITQLTNNYNALVKIRAITDTEVTVTASGAGLTITPTSDLGTGRLVLDMEMTASPLSSVADGVYIAATQCKTTSTATKLFILGGAWVKPSLQSSIMVRLFTDVVNWTSGSAVSAGISASVNVISVADGSSSGWALGNPKTGHVSGIMLITRE